MSTIEISGAIIQYSLYGKSAGLEDAPRAASDLRSDLDYGCQLLDASELAFLTRATSSLPSRQPQFLGEKHWKSIRLNEFAKKAHFDARWKYREERLALRQVIRSCPRGRVFDIIITWHVLREDGHAVASIFREEQSRRESFQ